MNAIKNKLFENNTVQLDDTHFINCKFKGCKLVYQGGEAPIFDGCEFDLETKIKFNDDAFNTHRCMSEIYHKIGKPGKLFVENIFESIRKNIPPTTIN